MTMTEPGTPDVENLYARLGTGAPHLCFAGHTDVVPVGDEAAWTHPPFGGEVADGVLYGRGAVDMKGGIACFLAATLDYLRDNGGLKRGSLSFLITGDEESVAINGTPKLLAWLKARGETLDGCVVGEPTSSATIGDEIKIGRRGYLNAELLVIGKQGHSAYGERAENPIPKLARIIDRLSTAPLDKGTAQFQPSSLQATIISVPNTATNVIPGSARANFNIRYNDLHTRASLEAWVRAECEKAASEVGARFELAFEGIGRRVPDQARPAGRDHARGGHGGDAARAGADHQRRHFGRALHQGAVPRGRGRPAERDGASGRRARPGRRPRDADGDLPAVHRELFCGVGVRPVLERAVSLDTQATCNRIRASQMR